LAKILVFWTIYLEFSLVDIVRIDSQTLVYQGYTPSFLERSSEFTKMMQLYSIGEATKALGISIETL